MLSKLLRGAAAGDAQPFVFESTAGSTAQRAASPQPPSQDGEPSELDRSRARVRELETALELAKQQIPAARQTALKEGETAARAQSEAAVKPVLDRLNRSIQDVVEMKPRMRKAVEEEVVQLSLGIARRILRREMSMDAGSLQGLVQVAFERIGRQELVRVIAHPAQAAQVREALAHLTTRTVEILPDGSREMGTVIFETTRGAIDASVDSQLREIELGLADRLKWH